MVLGIISLWLASKPSNSVKAAQSIKTFGEDN